MPMPAKKPKQKHPSPSRVGLRNCCPQCGEGRLFDGVLKPAEACLECGLDYRFIDSGDGPAVFVILIVGFVITGLAMALQSAVAPPIWLHMLLWTPLVIVFSVWGLRFAKGVMIAMQFQTSASEGRLKEGG